MTDRLRQTLIFIWFTLREYMRSGRVLIEVLAAIIAAWVFFWPNGAIKGLDPTWFFSMACVLFLLLPAYTTLAIMRMGNRPRAYVVLLRDLGRGGYLAGLYGAAGAVTIAIYLLFNLIVMLAWSSRPHILTPGGWALGSLPLLLNAAIVSALCTLLAPLVLSHRPRLAIMGLAALVSAGSILTTLRQPGDPLLHGVGAALALPLLPALRGFELAARRDYSGASIGVLLGQLLLALGLLAAALFAFTRRELILRGW